MNLELSEMSLSELEMALIEWKRWRNRVRTAEAMRLRPERCEQAGAFISAIEQEVMMRSPEVRDRMLKDASATMQKLAGEATVALDDYRSARTRFFGIQRRKTR
jgi:hypothetical protein